MEPAAGWNALMEATQRICDSYGLPRGNEPTVITPLMKPKESEARAA